MKVLLPLVAALAFASSSALARRLSEPSRWKAEAARVEIVRDDWGIAHVTGKTDADAVFGMIYAQAEDDVSRVESNYLAALGRRAEAEGEAAIWADLRQRLIVDPEDLKAKYRASPPWLRRLMDAWADGLNYYLATHRSVRARVITRFEPWMALSFTEGSIGPDIENATLNEISAFYGRQAQAALPALKSLQLADDEELPGLKLPLGSNGVAIAPKNTLDGHALLLINPHTSHFFRAEMQVMSGEGLNVYGASTWGQFFVYQGFNAHAGWMHTSSGVDNVDRFAETVARRGRGFAYRYGQAWRPVVARRVVLRYRRADGSTGSRAFTTWATHHGPIITEQGGRWIAMALLNDPVHSLEQSVRRNRVVDYASLMKVGDLKANSSNNTLFADDKGEIAYLHPQFVPVRDPRFNYAGTVDGSDPATDWKGLHALSDLPQAVNPKSGWVYNSNEAPWMAAGPGTMNAADYPAYMDTKGLNGRSIHAVRLFSGRQDFTLRGLTAAAYDPWMPRMELLVPALTAAWDRLGSDDPLRLRLADPILALKGWDHRWGLKSVETTVAVTWATRLMAEAPGIKPATPEPISIRDEQLMDWMARQSTDRQKLDALAGAVDQLTRDFGAWRTPWGEVNRFQRLSDDPHPVHRDDAPSLAVPFTSARWGSLASFEARPPEPGLKRRYGNYGNSFVAVVEFGPRVRAVAITAGGESGDPRSPHFNDQAPRFAAGDLRPVYFWPDELKGHIVRRYHPGG